MKIATRLVLLAAVVAVGCEPVAWYVYQQRQDEKDDDDAAAVPAGVPVPPPPDPSYRVWIASIDAPSAADERDAIAAARGNPDQAVWSLVGSATASATFDPDAPPDSFTAVLVQANAVQAYRIDAVEILDADDHVTATAAGTAFSSLVLAPDAILGGPDGLTADTEATETDRAFVFALFTVPIERIRISAHGAVRASGDVEWSVTRTDPGNDTPGGVAVNSAGVLHVTASDWVTPSNRNVVLLRFDATGAFLGSTTIQSGVTATVGSHSVAIDATDSVYVTTMVGANNFALRKFNPALGLLWQNPYGDPLLPNSDDRVEHNSVAIDGSQNVIVAGKIGSGTILVVQATTGHWMTKVAPNGATVWTQTLGAFSNADTHWRAVAADAEDNVFTGGDLANNASGFVEDLTRRTLGANQNSIVFSEQTGDNASPADRIQAVAPSDTPGGVVSAGYYGTTAQGRDAVVMKYAPAGSVVWLSTYNGPDNLDDEILDLATDVDGTVYAAGYSRFTAGGERFWLRKFTAGGVPVWTRTYDGAAGDDRLVGIVLRESSVIVVGSVAGSGGNDIHVRSYVK